MKDRGSKIAWRSPIFYPLSSFIVIAPENAKHAERPNDPSISFRVFSFFRVFRVLWLLYLLLIMFRGVLPLNWFFALEHEDGAAQAEQAQRQPRPERRRGIGQPRPDASDLRRVGPRPSRPWRDVVGHSVDLAIAEVEPLHLFEVERARASAVEDRDLVA